MQGWELEWGGWVGGSLQLSWKVPHLHFIVFTKILLQYSRFLGSEKDLKDFVGTRLFQHCRFLDYDVSPNHIFNDSGHFLNHFE